MTDKITQIEQLYLHVEYGLCAPCLDSLNDEVTALTDERNDLKAKLAKVTAAYRLEAMKRDDYSHDTFDMHLAELTGGKDD